MEEGNEQSSGLTVQKGLEEIGYSRHLTFKNNEIQDTEANKAFKAKDLKIDGVFRFEGPSDPDNLSVVYALSSNSGEKGLLVDAYGTYGDPALSEFMRGVKDKSEESRLLVDFPSARTYAVRSRRNR